MKRLAELKPTERLMVLALKLTPNQTADQLTESAGISQRYHVLATVRTLAAMGVVIENTAVSPTTYSVTEAV